jgi:hypothetical protein
MVLPPTKTTALLIVLLLMQAALIAVMLPGRVEDLAVSQRVLVECNEHYQRQLEKRGILLVPAYELPEEYRVMIDADTNRSEDPSGASGRD